MGNKYFESHEWNVFLDRTFGPLSWIYNSENVFEGSCFILKHLDRFFFIITKMDLVMDWLNHGKYFLEKILIIGLIQFWILQ